MQAAQLGWVWGENLFCIFMSITKLVQGNGNNFVSLSQCFTACQPEEEDLPHVKASSSPLAREDESEDPEDVFYNFPIFLPFPQKPDNSPSKVCASLYDEGPCHPLDPAKFLRRYYHNKTAGNNILPEVDNK